jgi:hypothetical protein
MWNVNINEIKGENIYPSCDICYHRLSLHLIRGAKRRAKWCREVMPMSLWLPVIEKKTILWQVTLVSGHLHLLVAFLLPRFHAQDTQFSRLKISISISLIHLSDLQGF